MMIGNPVKFASYSGQRLDGHAGIPTDKLDKGWYQDLLVMTTSAVYASMLICSLTRLVH